MRMMRRMGVMFGLAGTLALPARADWVLSSAPTNGYWQAVACSSNGAVIAAAINGGTVYVSTNSGSNWAATSAGSQSWAGLACSGNGRKLAAGPQGGAIAVSTNGGTTWAATGSGSQSWYGPAGSADGSRLIAGGFGAALVISTNGGATWSDSGLGSLNWTCVASSADGMKLLAGEFSGPIHWSTNGGASWAVSDSPSVGWVGLAVSTNGSRAVAAAYGDGVYVSTNYGANWTVTSAPTGNWYGCSASGDGSALTAVIFGDGIYSSTDGGGTWSADGSAPTASWSSVCSSMDGKTRVAAVYGGGIYVSGSLTNPPPGAPTVSFSGTPTSGVIPLSVSFTNHSSGATNYAWSFGNGATSSATNPAAVLYTNVGSFTVGLTAVGPGGINNLVRSNYVSTILGTVVVTLTNGPSPAVQFSNVTVSVVVTNSGTNAGTPTGLVMLKNNGYWWATNTLSGGATSFGLTNLYLRGNSLQAYYAGDTNFPAAWSASSMQYVATTGGLALAIRQVPLSLQPGVPWWISNPGGAGLSLEDALQTMNTNFAAVVAGGGGGLSVTQNVVLFNGGLTNLLAFTNAYVNGLLVASGPYVPPPPAGSITCDSTVVTCDSTTITCDHL